jgi:hypothetical protein
MPPEGSPIIGRSAITMKIRINACFRGMVPVDRQSTALPAVRNTKRSQNWRFDSQTGSLVLPVVFSDNATQSAADRAACAAHDESEISVPSLSLVVVAPFSWIRRGLHLNT